MHHSVGGCDGCGQPALIVCTAQLDCLCKLVEHSRHALVSDSLQLVDDHVQVYNQTQSTPFSTSFCKAFALSLLMRNLSNRLGLYLSTHSMLLSFDEEGTATSLS